MWLGGFIVKKHGFTLIELSIVIVIIGLIVAGVVGGRALVESSKIRTVISEFKQFEVAFNTFRLTYSAYPGDMTDAHSYWGSSCDSTASNCNGDGDRLVDWGVDNDADREIMRTWQHMALAGVLPGTYSGESNSGIVAGPADIPFSKSGLGKYFMETGTDSNSFGGDGSARMEHLLMIGLGGGTNISWWTGSTTVQQASNVDRKLDDGVANKGRLYGLGSDCSAAHDNDGGADYQLDNASSSEKYCRLQYYLLR
jgi:prepilin-type N-terminal cleavage/methylation domain-containing protein